MFDTATTYQIEDFVFVPTLVMERPFTTGRWRMLAGSNLGVVVMESVARRCAPPEDAIRVMTLGTLTWIVRACSDTLL